MALDANYDVFVVGTGLVESIVASACARAGKTVFQVDDNDYYGGRLGTLDFASLIKWIGQSSSALPDAISKQARQYAVDLTPSLVNARGALVDLLISSGVGKYLEFRNIEKMLAFDSNKWSLVPSNRTDVFKSNEISLLEKRFLMKFLNSVVSKEDAEVPVEEFSGKPFVEYLGACRLPEKLQQFVLYSLCMIHTDQSIPSEQIMTEEGIDKMRHFLRSLGRYSENSAHLTCSYGDSEVAQAFCRLVAVYGGIQMLRCGSLEFEQSASSPVSITSVKVGGEHMIRPTYCVMTPKYVPGVQYLDPAKNVARAVVVVDKSIDPASTGLISGCIPPQKANNSHTVFVLQVDDTTDCVPKGKFMVHFTCDAPNVTDAASVLAPVIQSVFAVENAPNIEHVQYFLLPGSCIPPISSVPENLMVCSDAVYQNGFDVAVDEARAIFARMYPGEPFIPAVPNPEDDVHEDDPALSGVTETVTEQSTENEPVEKEDDTVNTQTENAGTQD